MVLKTLKQSTSQLSINSCTKTLSSSSNNLFRFSPYTLIKTDDDAVQHNLCKLAPTMFSTRVRKKNKWKQIQIVVCTLTATVANLCSSCPHCCCLRRREKVTPISGFEWSSAYCICRENLQMNVITVHCPLDTDNKRYILIFFQVRNTPDTCANIAVRRRRGKDYFHDEDVPK